MGRHEDEVRSRGVARWLIASIVAVVLLAGAAVAYIIIVNRDPTGTAAGDCSGSAVLAVEASTGAAGAMSAAATAFDATKPVARSTCVTTAVHTAPGPEIADGLAADWAGKPPPAPAFWAADSATDFTGLEKIRSDLTAGRDTEPIGTSPVVLAVRAPDAVAVEGLSWTGLPVALGSSGKVQLPSGARLTLALPDPSSNRASAYALESAIAAGSSAVTVSHATAAADTVRAVAAGSDLTPNSTAEALAELASGSPDFNAVPVVESDLATFNETATQPLTAVYPSGAAAGDQMVTSSLTAAWVDPTVSEAGATFHAYLRSTGGQAVLASAHLRVSGVRNPVAPGVDFAKGVTALPAAEPGVAGELASQVGTVGSTTPSPTATSVLTTTTSARTTATSAPPSTSTTPSTSSSTPKTTTRSENTGSTSPSTSSTSTSPSTSASSTPPATGPVITLVIDTSSTMGTTVDGRTRISYAQDGLRAAVAALTGGDVGLWSFSSNDATGGYITLVPTGPLSGGVDGVPRTEKLVTAIEELAPGGTRTMYPAAVAAYQSASDNAVAGRDNRVVLVTDGVDETPGVSRASVVAQLAAIREQGKNVRLDILGVGEAPPAEALTELATAGGGTYTAVPTTPELPAAIEAAAR